MEKQTFFWSKVIKIYQQVFSVLRKNPMVFFLFLLIALLDLVALMVLYFAPSPPVLNVLGPVIRSFWGDSYLHYPNNFLLLPKLFSHAHFLISTIVGVFITGIIIKKIEAETLGQKVSTLSAAGRIFKRYFSLVAAWLLSYGIFVFALKGILPLLPKNLWLQVGSGFFLGLIIQSVLAFLLPALVLIENGFFKTLFLGFRFGVKNILLTGALIFVPMMLILILSVARLFTPLFVRIHPELVLWVLCAGIVVSLLVDICVTSSATLLFLKVRNEKS